MQKAYYDDVEKAVVIKYIHGDHCSDDKENHIIQYSTTVYFFCLPGNDQTQPFLSNLTSNGCHVEVTWYTSIACPIGHMTGDNCIIRDSQTGLNFDLTSLKKSPTSPTGYHKAVTMNASVSMEHDYYINVCGPVFGTPCDSNNDTNPMFKFFKSQGSNIDVMPNAGVCQVSNKYQDQVHNTGQWNSQLHFSDGRLKLIYKNGDNYRSNPPVPRHTDIEFVCDHQSGMNSSPVFAGETERTYKFIWRTSLACSSNDGGGGVNICGVSSADGKFYDLSSLSMYSSNWVMVTRIKGRLVKLIFNICRSIVIGPETRSCDPASSACLIFLDSNETISLGRSTNRPIIIKENYLSLNFDLGDKCKQDSNLKNSLDIQLFCKHLAQKISPSSLEESSTCAYKVTWITSTACSLNTINNNNNNNINYVDSCRFNDVANNHIYYFNIFKGKIFDVVFENKHYKIALCGECKSGAAVCSGGGGGGSGGGSSDGSGGGDGNGDVLVKTTERFVRINNDSIPEIVFSSSKANISVQMLCTRSSSYPNNSLTFLKNASDWLIFTVSHASFCFKKSITCQTYDDLGNKYDLGPLFKNQGNYVAKNGRGDYVEFNVCGSIDQEGGNVGDVTCSKPTIGACIHNINNINNVSLLMDGGHVDQSVQVDAQSATLTLTYINGGQCRNDKRSTMVIFTCSPIQHEPVLISSNMKDCDLIIEWRTPHACPYKSSIGHDCKVVHPLYPKYTFDLTPMNNITREMDFDGGDKFVLRVCAPVMSPDVCRQVQAGGCLVHKDGGGAGEAYSMGDYNEELVFNDGKLTLTYTTSSSSSLSSSSLSYCQGNRSTTIDFVCEHDNIGLTSGPLYLGGLCHRRFEWTTSLACYDYHTIPCRVTTQDNRVIDLSPLTLHDDNYEVDVGDDVKYLINVCTTLVHEKGNRCLLHSAACMISRTESKDALLFSDVGQIPTNGSRDNIITSTGDSIRIIYTSQSKCGDSVTRTIINLYCDASSETSSPRFVARSVDGCDHMFSWFTKVVCSNINAAGGGGSDASPPTDADDGSCTAKDDYSGHIYDMSPLSDGGPYHVYDGKDHNYILSVCKPLLNSTCGKLSGSCQVETTGEQRSFNAGNITKVMKYEDGKVVVRYTGGQFCYHANKNRETLISFTCAGVNDVEGPKFVYETESCVYMFNWITRLACKNELTCKVSNAPYILSSLIRHQGHYNVDVSSLGNNNNNNNNVDEIYINLCKPVMDVARCPSGSAVCVKNKDGTYHNAGRLSGEPLFNQTTNQLLLMYKDGDECNVGGGVNKGAKYSSTITFSCSDEDDTSPHMTTTDPTTCNLNFQWKTKLVCSDNNNNDKNTNNQCIFNVAGPHHINMTTLSNLLANKKVSSTKNPPSYYLITLCSSSSSSSPVIQMSGDSANDVVLKRFEGRDKLKVISGSNDFKFVYIGGVCERDDLYVGSIIFTCDASVTEPLTQLIYESACVVVVEVRSKEACYDDEQSPASTTSTLFTSSTTTKSALDDNNINNNSNNINNNEHQVKTDAPNIIGAVVGVIIIITSIVIILVIVIYKKKSCLYRRFGRNYDQMGVHDYQYSRLSEREPVLLHNITYDDVSDDVINNINHNNDVTSRHANDDLFANPLSDDDDMLL